MMSIGRTDINEPRITSGYSGWPAPAALSSLDQADKPTVSGNRVSVPNKTKGRK